MRRLSLVLLLVSLAGCDALSGSSTEERQAPGVLVLSDPLVETISAPDTVFAGVPFTATVYTMGGGCIRRGDTRSTSQGRVAEIRPFDIVLRSRRGETVCTADLAYLDHTIDIVLDEPGVATIRAVGASVLAAFGEDIVVEEIAFERSVVVLR